MKLKSPPFAAAQRLLLPLLLCSSAAAWAGPTGPGPYNTGVDAAGMPLPSRAADPHFRIKNSTVFGPAAYAVNESDGAPVVAGTWLLDNPRSSWLVPTRDIFFTELAFSSVETFLSPGVR